MLQIASGNFVSPIKCCNNYLPSIVYYTNYLNASLYPLFTLPLIISQNHAHIHFFYFIYNITIKNSLQKNEQLCRFVSPIYLSRYRLSYTKKWSEHNRYCIVLNLCPPTSLPKELNTCLFSEGCCVKSWFITLLTRRF